MLKKSLMAFLVLALAGCGGTVSSPTSTTTAVTAATTSAAKVPMASTTQVRALEGCKTVAKIVPGLTELKPYMTPSEQQSTALALQGVAGLCITTNPPSNGNQLLTNLFGQLTMIATEVALERKGLTP